MVPAQVLGAFHGGWRAQKELKHDAGKVEIGFPTRPCSTKEKAKVQSIQLETIAP